MFHCKIKRTKLVFFTPYTLLFLYCTSFTPLINLQLHLLPFVNPSTSHLFILLSIFIHLLFLFLFWGDKLLPCKQWSSSKVFTRWTTFFFYYYYIDLHIYIYLIYMYTSHLTYVCNTFFFFKYITNYSLVLM